MKCSPIFNFLKTLTAWASLWIVILQFALPVGGRAVQEDECLMKSAFLGKFARYIKWPEKAGMTDKTKPFVIGILGESPMGALIEKLYSGKKIMDKDVEIRYISTLRGIYGCHILFIPSSLEKILDRVITVTKDEPILTVGDTSGFAEQGVLINFYVVENKIRFEINEPAVRHASLKVDSLLLEVARIVKSPGEIGRGIGGGE